MDKQGRTEKLREVQLATQTSLYVDLAVIILVYIAVLICIRKKWNIGLYVMLGLYLVLYSYLVLFSRRPYKAPILRLDLFWSYREAFNGLKIVHLGHARQILLNILVYIPLGMILVSIFRKARHPILWPLLIGLGLSVATEIIQYITALGITELDDVMDNGLGLLIGIGIIRFSLGRCGAR